MYTLHKPQAPTEVEQAKPAVDVRTVETELQSILEKITEELERLDPDAPASATLLRLVKLSVRSAAQLAVSVADLRMELTGISHISQHAVLGEAPCDVDDCIVRLRLRSTRQRSDA